MSRRFKNSMYFRYSQNWWSSLTQDEKVKCRDKYAYLREKALVRGKDRLYSKEVCNSKVSQLSDHQIDAIFSKMAAMEWLQPFRFTDEQREKQKFSNTFSK